MFITAKTRMGKRSNCGAGDDSEARRVSQLRASQYPAAMRAAVAMGWTWCFSVILLAQASKPMTAPATSDQTTPKAALKMFAKALDAGDRAAVMAMLQADSEQDKKVAAATADLAQATAQLREAAIKIFGAEKSRALGVDSSGNADAIKRIDSATESIQGDTATLRSPENEGPPLAMVKRDGVWRVPVSELSKDVEPADIDKNLADMNRQIKLMRELTAEVASRKYTTATEARQVLDKRILSTSLPPITTAPSASTKP